MKFETKPTFLRVHDRDLSLWQSAAAEVVKKELTITQESPVSSMNKVLEHSMMRAVNSHILLRNTVDFEKMTPDIDDEDMRQARLSYLAFQQCLAKSKGDKVREDILTQQLQAAYRPFSDKDPNWPCCQTTYWFYKKQTAGKMIYHDWKSLDKPDIEYGLIKYYCQTTAK